MRPVAVASTLWSLVLAVVVCAMPAAWAEGARGSPLNPCAAPNEISASFEETAWRIWVAATCPVNRDQYPFVVWENWIEQAQLSPPDPSNGLKVPNSGAATATHLLHHSPLTIAPSPELAVTVPGLLGAPDASCNKAKAPPPDQPNLIFCEEVRVNGAAEDYIAGANLWHRTGQAQAAANGDAIEFPRPAVEVKVDWTWLNSIGLDCNHLPDEFTTHPVPIETIHGQCFALTGLHVMSKLIDQWLWATFEPQNSITKPNRCKELGCVDPFGSRPAESNGGDTQLSPELAQLMEAAHLAPAWKNYRLNGVQTDYFSPQHLINSVIEGANAGIPADQASCLTCHDVSAVKSDGTDGLTFLNPDSRPVGLPEPLPSTAWSRRDFVWSLLLACPNADPRFQTCVP